MVDVDSLPIEVHGKQPGSGWNGYCKATVYHPLVASATETGDLLDARLRAACGRCWRCTGDTARPRATWAGGMRGPSVDAFACNEARLLVALFSYQIMHVLRALLERVLRAPARGERKRGKLTRSGISAAGWVRPSRPVGEGAHSRNSSTASLRLSRAS